MVQLSSPLSRLLAPTLALSLIWGGPNLIAPQPVSAQSLGDRLQNLFQRSRPLRNASGTNSGGAVRGNGSEFSSCKVPDRPVPLKALSPNTNQIVTMADQPTFWFYVPYGRNDGLQTAELMLFEEDWDYFLLDPIEIPLPDEPGLISFTLPPDTPQMAVGEEYNWHFSLVCDPNRIDGTGPWVNGWVGRVATPSDLTSRLEEEDAALVYVDAGFWGEALTTLAQDPDRYGATWLEVLELFGLDQVEDLPVRTIVLGDPSAAAAGPVRSSQGTQDATQDLSQQFSDDDRSDHADHDDHADSDRANSDRSDHDDDGNDRHGNGDPGEMHENSHKGGLR